MQKKFLAGKDYRLKNASICKSDGHSSFFIVNKEQNRLNLSSVNKSTVFCDDGLCLSILFLNRKPNGKVMGAI